MISKIHEFQKINFKTMSKRLITICAVISVTASVFLSQQASAQTPEKMSYQAVVRDGNNDLLTEAQVGMQISILQGSASGTAVYVETQTPTANTNGLVSLEIGSGTAVSGDFTTINWANGPYFIKTETDPTGGINYTISGTSQLMSVPYALYAKESGSSIPGPAGEDGVGITSTTDNNDGTFTLNFSDGSTFTTADLTGPQGATGPTGPQGAAGQDGQDGVGITSTTNNNDGTFTLNFSDNTSFTTADLTGPQGPAGNIESLADGSILVGDTGNAPTAVSLSGDATLANDGALTISNDAINTSKIQDASVTDAKLDKNNIPLSGFGAAQTDIDLGSNKILFANVYSSESDLPSASTYHGMFAHVHGTGKAYYAHAGNWVEIANKGELNLALVLAENNSANDQQIKDLADPTDEQDAATKNYVDNTTYTQAEVDNLISGLQNQINDLQNPVNYDVTNNGSSAYTFDGGGFTNSSNPDLTLERGKTYTFTINASGHPFYINTVNATGTNNAYSSGVTNNGTQNGTITFTVPQDAPDTLYYNCQYHSTMNGTITITD